MRDEERRCEKGDGHPPGVRPGGLQQPAQDHEHQDARKRVEKNIEEMADVGVASEELLLDRERDDRERTVSPPRNQVLVFSEETGDRAVVRRSGNPLIPCCVKVSFVMTMPSSRTYPF